MVLGREDLTRAPPNFGAEGGDGLDEDGSLDRHVERPGDAGAFEGLRWAEFSAAGHETGHFDLGELNLKAAEFGLGDIFDFVFATGWGFGDNECHWGWEFGTMGSLCGGFCLK